MTFVAPQKVNQVRGNLWLMNRKKRLELNEESCF